MTSITNTQTGTFRIPDDETDASEGEQADLIELKDVVARGDYDVPAHKLAAKMLSAKVFHLKKHG